MAKTSKVVQLGGIKSLHVHKPCAAYEGCTHKKHGYPKNGRQTSKQGRRSYIWPPQW